MSIAKIELTGAKIDAKVRSRGIDAILKDVIRNEKLIPWCSLLCYEGNSKDFLNVLDVAKSEMLGVMQYRRNLMSERSTPITCVELTNLHTKGELGELHRSLELLFLEVIEESHFKFIMKKIDDNKLESMYNRHTNNNGLRIMSVALVV